ncbi:MAG: peptide-methionine (R)-S-oxide reductase MsrB [Cyanobacteria bacterium P01_D01_bin.105]
MKKRHFLQTSASFLGVFALSSCSLQQTDAQAESLPDSTAKRSFDPNQFEVSKTPDEWREILSPEAFSVLREHGTERPFTSPLNKLYESGTYVCAGCAQPLYSSSTKFDSGTGWPSFYAALPDAVGTSVDNSFLMTRTEVHCARCGGHLGHIFNDGPQPTGKRHCINGVALKFVEA